MKVEIIGIKGTWRDVADAARTTIGLDQGDKVVSNEWKQRMLLAEHSPIRKIIVCWKWKGMPYWVSVHFTRHKFGVEHFVATQRSDRTGVNRNNLRQGEPVTHECEANLQAIINISRKRLCRQASPETTKAWKMFLKELRQLEPELVNACVPECVYRGKCFEYKSCGYDKSQGFDYELEKYRGWIV